MPGRRAAWTVVAAALVVSCGSKEELPPQAVCGDGVVDPGEVCDAGESNGQKETQCNSDCTIRQAPPGPSPLTFDFPARRIVRDGCIKPLPDLDGDGRGEVEVRACAGPGHAEIRTSLNGPVLFTDPNPNQEGRIEVADFDGDGNLDLLSCGYDLDAPTGHGTLWMGAGDGSFVQVSEFLQEGGLPRDGCAFQVADLDFDGDLDVVIQDFSRVQFDGIFALKILRNMGGRRLLGEEWQFVRSFFVIPNGFALADLNGDRIVDIVTYLSSGSGVSNLIWHPIDEDGQIGRFFAQELAFDPLVSPHFIDVSGTGRQDLFGLAPGTGFVRVRFQGQSFETEVVLLDHLTSAFDLWRDATQRLRMAVVAAVGTQVSIEEYTSFDAANWRLDRAASGTFESIGTQAGSAVHAPVAEGEADEQAYNIGSIISFPRPATVVGEPGAEELQLIRYGTPRYPWRLEAGQPVVMLDATSASFTRDSQAYRQPRSRQLLHRPGSPFLACDFDGDGSSEIVATASIAVLGVVNTSELQQLTVPGLQTAVACADVEGRGRDDFVVVATDGTVRLSERTARGDFELADSPLSVTSTPALSADVDDDGHADFILGGDVYFGSASDDFALRSRSVRRGDSAALAWSDAPWGSVMARIAAGRQGVELWNVRASGEATLTSSVALPLGARQVVGRTGPSGPELIIVNVAGLYTLQKTGALQRIPLSLRGWFPMHALTADLDDDGIDEIVVSISTSSFNAELHKGFVIIPGTATTPDEHVWFGAHGLPLGLIATDHTGDGRLEIAALAVGAGIPFPNVERPALVHFFEWTTDRDSPDQ